MLHIILKVKFRAFFKDIARWQEEWSVPLGGLHPASGIPANRLIDFSRQGISLFVEII